MLVVAPFIADYNMSKVLMDGGAILNILYVDNLNLLRLDESKLKLT